MRIMAFALRVKIPSRGRNTPSYDGIVQHCTYQKECEPTNERECVPTDQRECGPIDWREWGPTDQREC